MKRLFTILIIMILCLGLAACASAKSDAEPAGGVSPSGDGPSRYDGALSKAESAGTGEVADYLVTDGGGDEAETPAEPPVNTQPTVPAGQLTAAEWNDLENYEAWLKHFEQGQTAADDGIFLGYTVADKPWKLPYNGMSEVLVLNGETPVAGASVVLTVGNNTEYKAVTNAKGVAYIFTGAKSGKLTVTSGTAVAEADWTSAAKTTVKLNANAEKRDVIEIMFVIDTTGSMGDELTYIKSEVDNVITRIKTANTGSTVRLALLFYRDNGDTYVTDYYDFTEDVSAQKSNLAKQSASGGGDFPEAVDVALDQAVAKNWSADATTKLVFHILDAPPHTTEANAALFKSSILAAAAKGIRLIPVASSGIDKETEYLLREEAMLTGGTYVFVTNDSGIGGSHIEASVGEYTVELLDSLLVRLTNEYHSGTDIAPIDWRQEVRAE